MKSILLMLPLCGLVIAAASQAQEADKDKKALQGTWIVVSAAFNDKPVASSKGDKFTFQGDKLIIENKVKKTDPVTFKLDASKTPKQIDFDEKTPSIGIYQFEKDLLWICYGSKRPDGFKSSTGLLLVLKRENK